jgi:hypothetical protein
MSFVSRRQRDVRVADYGAVPSNLYFVFFVKSKQLKTREVHNRINAEKMV